MSKHSMTRNEYELVDNLGTSPSSAAADNKAIAKNPIWLNKVFLTIFSALIVVLWACLILLWRLSISEDGFVIGVIRNHLAWKYGPTTILVLILSLWRKVDYSCKWTQPWINMTKGYVSARRSILLDYSNSLEELNLANSLRDHDFRVSASVAGIRLLQVAIIASTALLTAIPTETLSQETIQYNTTFDGTDFWQVFNSGSNGATSLPDVFSFNGFLSDSAANAYFGTLRPTDGGIIAFNAPINYPQGTVNGSAYQSFTALDHVDFNTVTAAADVFVPLMKCEVATIQQVSASQVPEVEEENTPSFLALLLSSNECPASGAFSYGAWGTMNCTTLNETSTPWSCSDVSQSIAYLDCDAPGWLGDNVIANRGTGSARIDASLNLTTVGFYAVNITNSPMNPRDTATDYDHILTNAAGFVCDMQYSIESVNVTLNRTSQNFTYEIPQVDQPNVLPDLSQTEFAQMMTSILYTSGGAFPAISRTLLHAQNGEFTFYNNETMRDALVTSLDGISSQFMQQYFLRPNQAEGVAEILSNPERLHVASFALWVMIACLVPASVMPLFIIMTGSRDVLPIPTTSMARQAAVLTSSPALQQLLANSGSSKMTDLEVLFKSRAFLMASGVNVQPLQQPKEMIPQLSQTGHWKPFAARKISIFGTTALPLTCIAVVEILYRISERNEGFAAVPASNNSTIFILLTPALILALIAACYQNLDFLVAVLVPYNHIQSWQSLTVDLVGSYPFVSLLRSFRYQYFDFSIAKIAGLLAGILTVFGSGLFYIDAAASRQVEASGTIETFWNLTWPDNSFDDDSAATQFDSIRLGRALPSVYSWGHYVLPIADSYTEDGDLFWSNYTIPVTGLRGKLDCISVPFEDITIVTDPGVLYRDRWNITARAPMPDHCSGDITFTTPWLDMEYTGLVGLFFDLFVGPDTNNTNDVANGMREITLQRPANPMGCPSLGMFFGSVDKQNLSNLTALVCSQKMQQTQFDVTYVGMAIDQELDREHPPVQKESTYLTQDGFDTFPYRVEKYIQALNSPDLDPEQIENYGVPIDRFFSRLVNSSSQYFVDPTGLIGNDEAVIEAVEGLYQKYMVVAIENNMRDLDVSNAVRVDGTAVFVSSRLRVDDTSKIVLQVLLALITVLGVIVYSICDMKGVLPRNPCSIASCMALLAGSHLCSKELIPVSSEKLDDDHLKGLMSGLEFGLGWWRKRELGTIEFRNGLDSGTSEPVIDDNYRFGIDVGRPEIVGYQAKKDGLRKGYRRLHFR